jgi:imidazolonepropionase
MKTLWQHCHVATMAQGVYSIIEDAAIVTSGAHIEWIGPRSNCPLANTRRSTTCKARGSPRPDRLPHPHGVRRQPQRRIREAPARRQLRRDRAQGGGIASTVRATRAASEDELFASAAKRLKSLMRDGVTTVEIKSGYGLDLASERKMLRVIRRLGAELPISVRSTCLAAHALPPEYKDRADDYIEHICAEMLPALAAEGLVDAVDAFCEYLAFSPEQVERVFITAQELGLPVKLHAEQLSSLHGSSLAARYRLSADHLEFMTEDDAIAMAKAGTVAVLLPGVLLPARNPIAADGRPAQARGENRHRQRPQPRHLAGAVVAPDAEHGLHLFPHDPGRSPGRRHHSRATSLGMADTHGSLEVGKVADFVAWQIDRPADLAYWLGGDLENASCVTASNQVCRRAVVDKVLNFKQGRVPLLISMPHAGVRLTPAVEAG